MAGSFKQAVLLILAAALLAACGSALTPMGLSTALPATPVVTVAAPTVASTPILLPTATALPAEATSPSATTPTPPVEDAETQPGQDDSSVMETNQMNIKIGGKVLTATLAENTSVDALKAALAQGEITINMRDYASMEKVGSLGMDLPRNDEQITTEAGDIILYQGNAFVIYYAPNSWNFTRLGKVNDVTPEELREILGDGNVTVTLSLPQK